MTTKQAPGNYFLAGGAEILKHGRVGGYKSKIQYLDMVYKNFVAGAAHPWFFSGGAAAPPAPPAPRRMYVPKCKLLKIRYDFLAIQEA